MAMNIEVSNPLHFPNHFSIIVVSGLSIPEFSANSLDSDSSPSNALVILLSGAVLFGINVTACFVLLNYLTRFSSSFMSPATPFIIRDGITIFIGVHCPFQTPCRFLLIFRLPHNHHISACVRLWFTSIPTSVSFSFIVLLKKYIIKDFGNSVEVTAGYIEVLFQKH